VTEPFTGGTRVVRAPGALWRRVLDGVLVLAPGQDEPLLITPPGDVVWQLLADPITVDELTEELAELYETPAATVRADLEPVLAVLGESGASRQISTPNG
jgi:hypothetical protein